ncbi:hypothetical protein AT55_02084 [Streptococcus equi subsp. zooepidemicus Sz4is]|uniref:Uncharacterized protein n=1 Tax=Streptococcus equi subsp. zooepidemicus Sz4is TaxID=1381082 RepID=A0AAW3GIT2_STRSZ|nr:hypothetical protein AT55_02084 [Streptococcus equi subsp. zooepidemicus Sz4is]
MKFQIMYFAVKILAAFLLSGSYIITNNSENKLCFY